MTYDLHEHLVERERTAPVGRLDVAAVAARTAHRRTARVATRLVSAAAGCALVLGLGHAGWTSVRTAPAGPDVAPAPTAPATAPACGDPLPAVAGSTAGLSAVAFPELPGAPGPDTVTVNVDLRGRSGATFDGRLTRPVLYLAADDRIVSAAASDEAHPVHLAPGSATMTIATASTLGCTGDRLPDGTYALYTYTTLVSTTGTVQPVFTGGLPVTMVDGSLVPVPVEPARGLTTTATVAGSGADRGVDLDIAWDQEVRAGDTLTVQATAVALDATGRVIATGPLAISSVTAPDRHLRLPAPGVAEQLAVVGTGQPLPAGEHRLRILVSGFVVSADGTRTEVVGDSIDVEGLALG
ncbi:hypothetical protein [Cellulomonas sp. URHB0016]